MRTYRDTTADFSGPTFPSTAAADTTTWNYDPATGVLLQKLYADNKCPAYTYYADGLLKTRIWARTDANNNPLTTTYTYTVQDQLANIDYSDTTPGVTYTYNVLGQRTAVTDGSGTRTYAYDPVSLALTQEVFTGTVNGTLRRTYDTYARPTGYVLLDSSVSSSGSTTSTGSGSGSTSGGGTPAQTTALTAATYAYDAHGNFSQVHGDTVPTQFTADAQNTALISTLTTNQLTPSIFKALLKK
jgi:hypothetical protein